MSIGICLAGVDGVGKTTTAEMLLEHFRDEGKRTIYRRIRYPHLFCLPLLAYARLAGFTQYVTVKGVRHGRWEFHRSWLLSSVFPWVLLVDTAIFSLLRLYLPLALGFVVICDRCVYDVLVDLMMGLDNREYFTTLAGKLYLALMPRPAKAVVLDLDPEHIRARRTDLADDPALDARRQLYLALADYVGVPVVVTERPVAQIEQEILAVVCSNQERNYRPEA